MFNRNTVLSAVLLTAGCATQGVDRANEGVLENTFYAVVTDQKEVTLSSDVPTGALIGGIGGALEESDGNHQDIIAGSLAGALIGGLFTWLSEGDNQAVEYALETSSQEKFKLVQKERLEQGVSCVKVTSASKTTIAKADNQYCHWN